MESKEHQLKEIESQMKSAFGWYAREVYQKTVLNKVKMNTVIFVPAGKYINNLMHLIKEL